VRRCYYCREVGAAHFVMLPVRSHPGEMTRHDVCGEVCAEARRTALALDFETKGEGWAGAGMRLNPRRPAEVSRTAKLDDAGHGYQGDPPTAHAAPAAPPVEPFEFEGYQPETGEVGMISVTHAHLAEAQALLRAGWKQTSYKYRCGVLEGRDLELSVEVFKALRRLRAHPEGWLAYLGPEPEDDAWVESMCSCREVSVACEPGFGSIDTSFPEPDCPQHGAEAAPEYWYGPPGWDS
jgi:hypothetical protein